MVWFLTMFLIYSCRIFSFLLRFLALCFDPLEFSFLFFFFFFTRNFEGICFERLCMKTWEPGLQLLEWISIKEMHIWAESHGRLSTPWAQRLQTKSGVGCLIDDLQWGYSLATCFYFCERDFSPENKGWGLMSHLFRFLVSLKESPAILCWCRNDFLVREVYVFKLGVLLVNRDRGCHLEMPAGRSRWPPLRWGTGFVSFRNINPWAH